jgi:hypothetical protein
MLKNTLSILFLMLLLSLGLLQGCATQKQELRLDKTLTLYASAIRWGDFQGATQFYSSPALYEDVKFDRLKHIKVTGYDSKGMQPSNDGKQLRQTVEIRYYDTEVGSEHQIIDQQVWNYDVGKEMWLLSSKMPEFNTK